MADAINVKYFLLRGSIQGNIARQLEHEYSYLDHETGAWISDAAVADTVNFEASTLPLTLEQAKEKAKQLVPTLEPFWIGDIDE